MSTNNTESIATDEGGPARRQTRMNTGKNHTKQPEIKGDIADPNPGASPPLNHLRISRTRTGGFKTTLTMNGDTPTTSTNSQVNEIATKKKGSPIENGKKKKIIKKAPQRWISLDCRDLKCKATPNTYVLLVRNLPLDITKEQLEEHFRKTGPGAVKTVRIPKDKGSADQTRGIAYVEFKNKISQKIGLRLHNTTLSGNQITVELTSGSGKAKRRRKKPASY